jgi:hypothetical protein
MKHIFAGRGNERKEKGLKMKKIPKKWNSGAHVWEKYFYFV